MALLDLADETLLQIGLQAQFHDLRNLARTCKQLQRVCDSILWRSYRIVVRTPMAMRHRQYVYRPPHARKCTFEEWSALWEKRIAHLLSKASVVRELTIEDEPQYGHADHCGWPESLPFAQDLMDAAMPAITACTAVTTLRLLGTANASAYWPSQLWGLIRTGFPLLQTLSLEANFVDIPSPGGLSKHLSCLRLRWCKGLVEDLLAHGMLLADTLSLMLPPVRMAPRPANDCFTPPSTLALHLKKLDVELAHHDLPGPVFDVLSIPHVDIDIHIKLDVQLKAHLPQAWRNTKPYIVSLVKQGLTGFDVSRGDLHSGDVHIKRPSLVEYPDFTPSQQDHLRSEEAEDLEQRAMDAYYALTNPFLWMRAGSLD